MNELIVSYVNPHVGRALRFAAFEEYQIPQPERVPGHFHTHRELFAGGPGKAMRTIRNTF